MREQVVWGAIVEVLDTFSGRAEASTTTVEEIAEDVLRSCVGTTPQDEVLVAECATGVVRFSHLCEGALQGYCMYLKRNRSNRQSMLLVAYVMIFLYRQLGGEKVRQLFHDCTASPRIEEYLSYLLNSEALKEHSYPYWTQYYDVGFLNDSVLKPLADIRDEAQRDVVDWFHTNGAFSGTKAPPPSSKVTSIEPTARSTKDPRKTLTFASPPEKVGAGPPVAAIGGRPQLPPAEVRDMAHTIPESRSAPVPRSQLTIHRSSKPLTTAVGFDFHHRLPGSSISEAATPSVEGLPSVLRTSDRQVKAMLEKEVGVSTTMTALRREAYVHQRRRDEERRHLLEKECSRHTSRDYERWRRSQAEREAAQREALLLERHRDEVRTAEKVSKAKADAEKQRHRRFLAMKVSAKEANAVAASNRKEELERQRRFVHTFRSKIAKCSSEAAHKMAEEKKKAVEQVRQESSRLKDVSRAAAEERKLQQAAIIEEIRQLRERLSTRRADLVEYHRAVTFARASDIRSNDGLERLTLRELHAELERVRSEQREEEENRRSQIIAGRAKEQRDREALLRLCADHRKKNRHTREATQAAREEQRTLARASQLDAETAKMLALHKKLETQREERRSQFMGLCEGERERQNDLLLRAVDDTALEKERWRQLEQGIINSVTANQIANAKECIR